MLKKLQKTAKAKAEQTSNHSHLMFCDFCKKDIGFSRLKILEKKGSIKRKGQKEDCEVRYFQCPHCGKKYLIDVKTSNIKKLVRDVETILTDFPRENRGAFERALNCAKNALMVEQEAINYTYKKQHPYEGLI